MDTNSFNSAVLAVFGRANDTVFKHSRDGLEPAELLTRAEAVHEEQGRELRRLRDQLTPAEQSKPFELRLLTHEEFKKYLKPEWDSIREKWRETYGNKRAQEEILMLLVVGYYTENLSEDDLTAVTDIRNGMGNLLTVRQYVDKSAYGIHVLLFDNMDFWFLS